VVAKELHTVQHPSHIDISEVGTTIKRCMVGGHIDDLLRLLDRKDVRTLKLEDEVGTYQLDCSQLRVDFVRLVPRNCWWRRTCGLEQELRVEDELAQNSLVLAVRPAVLIDFYRALEGICMVSCQP
jgi:hypothetical protein